MVKAHDQPNTPCAPLKCGNVPPSPIKSKEKRKQAKTKEVLKINENAKENLIMVEPSLKH